MDKFNIPAEELTFGEVFFFKKRIEIDMN